MFRKKTNFEDLFDVIKWNFQNFPEETKRYLPEFMELAAKIVDAESIDFDCDNDFFGQECVIHLKIPDSWVREQINKERK